MPSEKSNDKSKERRYKSDFAYLEEKPEKSRDKESSSSKNHSKSSKNDDIDKKKSKSNELESHKASSSSSSKKPQSSSSSHRKKDDYSDSEEKKSSKRDKSSHRVKESSSKYADNDRYDPNEYTKSSNKSSHSSKDKYEAKTSSSKTSSSKKYQNDSDNDHEEKRTSASSKSSKQNKENYERDEKKVVETNYDDAYEDDFDDDFENDSDPPSEKNNKTAPKEIKESEKSKTKSSKAKDYSSSEEYESSKKSSKSKSNKKYDDEDDYQHRPKENKIVKANALIKIPTDLVEVSSSKIYFNHDSIDRQKRRAKDLLKTIELDKKKISLLDLNPIEMRTVYSSHLKHQKVQTNDDTFEIEIQTDEIEESNKWTQFPPDDSKGCGSDDKFQKIDDGYDYYELAHKFRFDLNIDDLQNFMQRSSKVIETLLNEKNQQDSNSDLKMTKSDIEFSKGFVKFGLTKPLSEVTKSGFVTNCCFSKNDCNYFVTSFNLYNTKKDPQTLLNSSLLIVWNINEPNVPYRILVCESISTCICYFSFIVVSGNIDGSISIWDLRESANLHFLKSKNKISSGMFAIRSPTYTTAYVLQNENHFSEIKSIVTLQNSSDDFRNEVFMQLATLEIDCKLIIWTVVELKNVDLAIFETDLGLLPGGKLKLVKNSQYLLNNLIRTQVGKIPFQTLCMSSSNDNSNDFFVATNAGQIIHINRKGNKFTSSLLKSDLQESLLQITCVSFHSEVQEVFLAGYGNGEIRLYHKNYLTPIKTWMLGCINFKIKQIEWLQSKSSSFLVIDETDTLYMWDLLKDDTQPIFSKEITNLGGISFPAYKIKDQKENENKNIPFALFNQNSKEIELHFFTQEWGASKNSDKERKKFSKLIKNYLLTF